MNAVMSAPAADGDDQFPNVTRQVGQTSLTREPSIETSAIVWHSRHAIRFLAVSSISCSCSGIRRSRPTARPLEPEMTAILTHDEKEAPSRLVPDIEAFQC